MTPPSALGLQTLWTPGRIFETGGETVKGSLGVICCMAIFSGAETGDRVQVGVQGGAVVKHLAAEAHATDVQALEPRDGQTKIECRVLSFD